MQYEAPHIASRSAAPELEPVRVLLAEDDPVSQHVVSVLLDRLGYQRDLVTDGHEALIILARRSYDIILLDISMPSLDGITVAQQIRAREGTGIRPYIIAISTSNDSKSRARCVAAGMDAFVAKPIALHSLDLALQHALQTRRAVPKKPGSGEHVAVAPPPPRGAAPEPSASGSGPRIPPLRRTGEDSRPGVVGNDVSAYLAKGQAFLETMRAASQAGDVELLRRSALSLKGVARLLGAFELATLCAEMEAAPSASARALSLEAVMEIEAQFNLVRTSAR